MDRRRAEQILVEMIAKPTVNPMGRPCASPMPVERPMTAYLEQLFSFSSATLFRQLCSPRHENLVILVPGCSDGPATLLEAHMDTVPADDWLDRAFTPRVEQGRVYGRGACDDKGPLTSMVLAVLAVLKSGERPPNPVCLLAAGDEEYAQSGIKHFAENTDLSFGRGIFGEATGSVPVVQHKGTIRWEIVVHGKSAHSSRPELGRDAIRDAMRVMDALAAHQTHLRKRFPNPLMTGPTLTVTKIHGGRTSNAVADECRMAVDMRVVPGMDPAAARQGVIQVLSALEIPIAHGEVQLMTPPLSTPPDHRFVRKITEICSARLGTSVHPKGEPYGTDAAWMPGDGPAIVLGPGGIETAHAVDEFIELDDVVRCAEILYDVLLTDWNV